MPAPCRHCGESEVEVEPTTGQSICTSCGAVLEENNIVSEVQFVESSSGGQSRAVGQFISSDSTSARPMLDDPFRMIGRSSREMTYSSGKKQINELCIKLNQINLVSEAAYNFFRLCVIKGITKGRKRPHVIAACVYISCRTNNSPLMLIDVSDAVETDVFEVGRTYLKLANALCIKLNVMDPTLYVMRFSYRLQFGDQREEVSNTAMRLVQRMKKDWMHTGRRPSGVCGAALVIAARIHNFNRTVQDVIKVVRVHETTVRKRLNEFGNTPSSELTPEEFMNNDLTTSEDPPAFKAARRKEEEEKERVQKLLEEQNDFHDQFSELQKEIDRTLKDRRNKLRGKYAAEALASGPSSPSSSKESTDTVQFIADSTMASIHECLVGVNMQDTERDISKQDMMPSTSSMGLKQSIEESMQIRPSKLEPEDCGVLDLEGIDDAEIDSYILNNREQEAKSTYWFDFNKEYLEEMEKKKEQERLDEEQRIKDGKPAKKKRAAPKRKGTNQPANTAGEAMGRMIEAKKLSSKIDYSILENLNEEKDEDTDDNSEVHSLVSKSSRSSRTSRSSRRSGKSVKPIPENVSRMMKSISEAASPLVDADDSRPTLPQSKKLRLDDYSEPSNEVTATNDDDDDDDEPSDNDGDADIDNDSDEEDEFVDSNFANNDDEYMYDTD